MALNGDHLQQRHQKQQRDQSIIEGFHNYTKIEEPSAFIALSNMKCHADSIVGKFLGSHTIGSSHQIWNHAVPVHGMKSRFLDIWRGCTINLRTQMKLGINTKSSHARQSAVTEIPLHRCSRYFLSSSYLIFLDPPPGLPYIHSSQVSNSGRDTCPAS